MGNGQADDTAAIQRAVDSGMGTIRFPKGVFRITKTIEIDLDKVGYTSLSGDGTARIVMAGSGPAFPVFGNSYGNRVARDGEAGGLGPPAHADGGWDRNRRRPS